MKLLIINPGSTSTKISVYEDENKLFEENIFHDAPELLKYPHVNGQIPFRKKVILDFLKEKNLNLSDIDVFVGRGGSAMPVASGVMEINEQLYEDTRDEKGGSEHPAKLGVMLAHDLAKECGKKAYTMDPTNVDELQEAVAVSQKFSFEVGAQKVEFDQGVAKLSVVGTGIVANAEIASKFFEALFEMGINILTISTSEIKISCLIDKARAKDAMVHIHEKFEL